MPTHFDAVFRADAGTAVGYGHLVRCLSLAAGLPAGSRVGFAVAAPDPAVADRVAQAGHVLLPLPDGDPVAQARALADRVRAGALWIDLSYGAHFDQRERMRQAVGVMAGAARVTVLIDGLLDATLVRDGLWPIDVLLTPYVGALPPAPGPLGFVHLNGPRHAILDPAYGASGPRLIRPQADRVLVSFGGSDPLGLTRSTVAGLAESGRGLAVRVVLGGSMEAAARRAVEALACEQIQILPPRPNLVADMLWADVAITATGLTRYELAATGTPSVQVSLDALHHGVNAPFALCQTALYLGMVSMLEGHMIVEAAVGLLDDFGQRLTQSRNGQSLVDGQGVRRNIAVVEELVRARN